MGLTGFTDFGETDFGNSPVYQSGSELAWDAVVWHMSDWGPLCDFIQKKFGATKVVWDTEEGGCGSLENLNLYDWEDIVRTILKKKKILPLLLHVHNDLDIFIEREMRR
jgi:hypothetical protein